MQIDKKEYGQKISNFTAFILLVYFMVAFIASIYSTFFITETESVQPALQSEKPTLCRSIYVVHNLMQG